MIDEHGYEDGLFYAEHLRQSTLPGKPWAFSGLGGSPKVWRVKKQDGFTLTCEDGTYTIQPVDREHLTKRRV